MSTESEILRCTKNEAGKHSTEEPASMREVVVSQIDNGVPGDIREDYHEQKSFSPFPEKKLRSPPKAESLIAALVASALSQCFMTPGLLGAPSFKSSAKKNS